MHRGNRAGTSRARRISRRALLTGSVGLAGAAVGVGATVGVEAAIPSATGVGPQLPSPGEELMVEHGVLKRVLLAYEAVRDRLDAGRTVSTDPIITAAQLISDYVESFHEGLEGAYVFPRVRAQQPELVTTLLTQHDRGRHLTAAIQTLASDGLGSARARSTMSGYLDVYVRMYQWHEAWEDTVVYPLLRQLSSQRTLDELAERFSDLQDRQYGDTALQTMLQRIGGVEEQLGIHDLATFTPSL